MKNGNVGIARIHLLSQGDPQLVAIFDHLVSLNEAPNRSDVIDLLGTLTKSDSLPRVISAYGGMRALFPECTWEMLTVSEELLKTDCRSRSANFDVGVIVSCFRMGTPIHASALACVHDKNYDQVFMPFIIGALTGGYFWGRNSSEWRPTEQMNGEISNAVSEYRSAPKEYGGARFYSIGAIVSGLKKAAAGSEQVMNYLECEPRNTIARQLLYRRYMSLSFPDALNRLGD